jgi:hypothetical protein
LRAYVSVVPSEIGEFTEGELPWMRLKLHNHGNTPAKIIGYSVAIDTLANPIPEGFELSYQDRQIHRDKFVLHPTQDREITVVRDELVTPEELNSVRNSINIRVFIYGEIRYSDVFNVADNTHSTTFCVFIDEPGYIRRSGSSSPGVVPDANKNKLRWINANLHNEAD